MEDQTPLNAYQPSWGSWETLGKEIIVINSSPEVLGTAQACPPRFPAAAPQCQHPEGWSGLEVTISLLTVTACPLLWALTRWSPGNLPLSQARDTGTTHRLPTVTLGSRRSRAALQKVKRSGTLNVGSNFEELWKHPKDSWE